MKMDLTVGEILQVCKGRLVPGKETPETLCSLSVTSVALDSRKVTEGGVFLATPGERVDGHSFVASCFAKGAALAIVTKTPEQLERETGEPAEGWGSYVLVEDSFAALRDIAEYYRQKLKVTVVGITGSSGKTSTKEFVAGVLGERFRVLKTEGNLNNEVGVPLTLLKIRPEHQVAVVEMGISDFGEMHRLSKMAKPDICVITNIGQSHLDHLKSREGILRAKSEIFDFMSENGEICLNGEDDMLLPLTRIKGRKTRFFGLGSAPGQEVAAKDIVSKGLWGSDASLSTPAGNYDIHVPLPGVHMVLNAAAAACVAGILGLTPREIASGIGKITPVDGRNHLIRLPAFTLIDDCYNANPASMRAALDLLALADTEKTAILGDMFGLGEDQCAQLHGQVGLYASRLGIQRILCVGERSGDMYRSAYASRPDGNGVFYFPSLEALLEALGKEREKYVPDGCTVLVKASHAMEFEKAVAFLRQAGTG